MTSKRLILTAALGALLGLACSACGRSSTESSGGGSLLRVESEPAGTNCPQGGLAVLTGLDQDEDGILDDGEVVSTSYVCNGQDGHSTLIDTTDEPPGPNCPAGGFLVSSGLDLDDNGVLEPEEITATEYVCNGVDGQDGLGSLVSVMDEAAGANCPSGGQAVRSGVDSNRDGLLQPEEVTATDYVCNGATGADGQPGLTSLVRQEDAAPGDCPFEGRVVMTGLDEDRDGYLDDAEVQATSYVCNGEPGAPAHASLFELLDEPAGVNCPSGGTQVLTGLDTNDDGLLEPGEVMATNYVCDGGNLVLRVSNAEWGGVCQRGGVKAESGVDDNGNGVLDDDEVDQTQYVCNLFFVQISVGTSLTCAVVSDGTARCWGFNSSGGVGDGTTTDRHTPVAVVGLTNVVEISPSSSHACARLMDGTAKCWGSNSFGVLGDGTTMPRLTPVEVVGLSNVAGISMGYSHTCAWLDDGTARCWGRNLEGQLGDGTGANSLTPVSVSGITSAVGISAGAHHSCASISDGTIQCWGRNWSGELGDGSTTNRTTPVTVSGINNAAEVSAGEFHTCARLATWSVKCWGGNSSGQLGDGTTNDSPTPVDVPGLVGVAEVSSGDLHTCARHTYGTAHCWGHNGFGELGDGSFTDRLNPVPVSELSQATEIVAGAEQSCALLSDFRALCWGANLFGQIGDGTTTDRWFPTLVLWDVAP